jgi:hypothetical protein
MSAALWPASPWESPAARSLSVSCAENSTKPSAQKTCRAETAPAFQPVVPAFASVPSDGVTPTSPRKLVCPMRTSVRVEPLVFSAASTRRGKPAGLRLV